MKKRNEKVIELARIGFSAKNPKPTHIYKYIAAVFDLTDRQVRNIVEQWRKENHEE